MTERTSLTAALLAVALGGAAITAPSGRPTAPEPPTTAPLFVEHTDVIEVGRGPGNARAADFNSDGDLDLVITEQWDNTVLILLGNGDGTFEEGRRYTFGDLTLGLAVGNLNRDSIPDIAVTDYTGDLYVLKGRGNGTFSQAKQGRSAYGGDGLEIGDLDGDGRDDIVVASIPGDAVDVWSREVRPGGSRDGEFVSKAFISTNLPGDPSLADVDADGDLDILAYDLGVARDFGAFLNTGDWEFEAGPRTEVDRDVFSLIADDLDGDEYADVAVFEWPFSINLYSGAGDGSFSETQSVEVPEQPDFLTSVDLDDDGNTDIVSTRWDIITVLRGNGDGTVKAPFSYEARLPAPFDDDFLDTVTPGDFDGDGTLDLAATYVGPSETPGSVTVWLGN